MSDDDFDDFDEDIEYDVENEVNEEDEDEEEDEDGEKEKEEEEEKEEVDPMLRISNKSQCMHIVNEDERITSNCLQKSEMAYIISIRAEQIAKHSLAFVDTTGLHSAIDIAKKELYNRKCPLILRRLVGCNIQNEPIIEEWCVREMGFPT